MGGQTIDIMMKSRERDREIYRIQLIKYIIVLWPFIFSSSRMLESNLNVNEFGIWTTQQKKIDFFIEWIKDSVDWFLFFHLFLYLYFHYHHHHHHHITIDMKPVNSYISSYAIFTILSSFYFFFYFTKSIRIVKHTKFEYRTHTVIGVKIIIIITITDNNSNHQSI